MEEGGEEGNQLEGRKGRAKKGSKEAQSTGGERRRKEDEGRKEKERMRGGC